MLLQGVQKVCCCVVKLISFEIYEQNTVKKATIEDYLANFVTNINTLRHSSQAAKKFVIVNIDCFEIIGTKYVKKSQFLRNFCKFSESDLASAVQ